MSTISASLIVKNEESVMQRCLDSVAHWADEIVVVDTGSTDRTKEIAAAHPKVKLYDSEHFDKDTKFGDFQFNVAKNESIAKCTGDWIIWWDADDYIDEEGAALIRKLANETTEDCLFCFVCSYGALRFEHCRMFRNGKGIEFDPNHSCHEYLNSGGRPQYMRRDVVVQHLPGKKGVPSAVRNLAIMEKDYFERGYKDQRTMFYLANSYRESGRNDEAIEMYNEYLKVSQWKEERYFATLYKAQIFSLIGNLKDAYKTIYESLIEDDRFAESYCLMGDLLTHEGKLAKAKHWYEMALSMEVPADSRLFASHTSYDSYPKAKLKQLADRQSKQLEPNPEPKPKPQGKENRYQIPEDQKLAVFAVTALKYLADLGKRIAVVVTDEWQRDLVAKHALSIVDDGGVELSLPRDLRGKSEVEWYCRSAGFISKGPFPKPIKWGENDVA